MDEGVAVVEGRLVDVEVTSILRSEKCWVKDDAEIEPRRRVFSTRLLRDDGDDVLVLDARTGLERGG